MEKKPCLKDKKKESELLLLKEFTRGRVKGSKETDEQILSKYKEVVKHLKKGKSLRDVAQICNVSLGTVQKVKKILN